MPDDDHFPRDHGPGWVDAFRELRKYAETEGEELKLTPDRDPTTLDTAVESAIRDTLDYLETPDLQSAALELHEISQAMLDGEVDEDRLCVSSSRSGTDALLRQAVRAVAARTDPATILGQRPDALAEQLAREFVEGAARRYGLNRVAPFDLSDAGDALDVLAGFDLFMAGPLIGGIVGDLLSGALGRSPAVPARAPQ